MNDIFAELDKVNKAHVEADRKEAATEKASLVREIKDKKRQYYPHPMEWMSHIGPWKDRLIDFSDPNRVRFA
jgi:hypothetical protein